LLRAESRIQMLKGGRRRRTSAQIDAAETA